MAEYELALDTQQEKKSTFKKILPWLLGSVAGVGLLETTNVINVLFEGNFLEEVDPEKDDFWGKLAADDAWIDRFDGSDSWFGTFAWDVPVDAGTDPPTDTTTELPKGDFSITNADVEHYFSQNVANGGVLTVDIKDGIQLDSALDKAYLNIYDVKDGTLGEVKGRVQGTLEDSDGNGTLDKFTATELDLENLRLADGKYDFRLEVDSKDAGDAPDKVSDVIQDKLVFDSKAPEIKFVDEGDDKKITGGDSSAVGFSVSADTESVEYIVKNSAGDIVVQKMLDLDEKDLSNLKLPEDVNTAGDYKVTVKALDKANNETLSDEILLTVNPAEDKTGGEVEFNTSLTNTLDGLEANVETDVTTLDTVKVFSTEEYAKGESATPIVERTAVTISDGKVNISELLTDTTDIDGDSDTSEKLITEDGDYVVVIDAKDDVGNKVEKNVLEFTYDTTPPEMTVPTSQVLLKSMDELKSFGGEVSGDTEKIVVHIGENDYVITSDKFEAGDGADDPKTWSLDQAVDDNGKTISLSDGKYDVTVTALDKAGNTTMKNVVDGEDLVIDTMPPAHSENIPNINGNIYYFNSVDKQFEIPEDEGSGIKSFVVNMIDKDEKVVVDADGKAVDYAKSESGDSFVLNDELGVDYTNLAEGTKLVAKFEDNAGHTSEVELRFDDKAPEAPTLSATEAVTKLSDFKVTLPADKDVSYLSVEVTPAIGGETKTYTVKPEEGKTEVTLENAVDDSGNKIEGDGEYNVAVKAVDFAGNESEPVELAGGVVELKIDTKGPEFNPDITYVDEDANLIYYNESTDAFDLPVDTKIEEGKSPVKITVEDAKGNVVEELEGDYNVDAGKWFLPEVKNDKDEVISDYFQALPSDHKVVVSFGDEVGNQSSHEMRFDDVKPTTLTSEGAELTSVSFGDLQNKAFNVSEVANVEVRVVSYDDSGAENVELNKQFSNVETWDVKDLADNITVNGMKNYELTITTTDMAGNKKTQTFTVNY